MKNKSNIFSVALLLLASFMINVQQNLPKNESNIRSHVIQLESDRGFCTGIQIEAPSGDDLIMSAAHCKVLANDEGYINARIDDGRAIPRRIVEVQEETDLMILEGMPNLQGIKIAKEAPLHRIYQAYTHGKGQATHRADGEYLEEKQVEVLAGLIFEEKDAEECLSKPGQKVVEGIYCVRQYQMVVTTIDVEPGSSGGPIVNDADELVGIVSSANSFFSNIVPLHSIHDFIAAY